MKHLMAGLAMTIGLALPAQAATVLNGSFEDGPVDDHIGWANNVAFSNLTNGGWDIYSELAYWKSGEYGVEVQTSATVGIDAEDGNKYLELDSSENSFVEQSVFLNAGAYFLNFWYSPRVADTNTDPALNTNSIKFEIGNGDDKRLDDVVTGSVSEDPFFPARSPQVDVWTNIIVSFDVESDGDYALKFAASGPSNGYGGFLDNVSITEDKSMSAVPVPAAGGLMIVALGGLALLRRRKV